MTIAGRTRNLTRWTVLSILLLVSAWSGPAHAWPTTAQWIPIYKNSALLQDPSGDSTGSRNVVSDPTHDAAFIFNDGTYLYFRLRLDKDPSKSGGLDAFGWGVEFDTDRDASDYEWLMMVNGIAQTEVIELWHNTAQGTLGDPGDKSEVLYTSILLAGNFQVSAADTAINGDQDYFLDWRFPSATFKQALNLTDSSPIRLFYGSSPSTNNLSDRGGDLVGGSDLYTGLTDTITPLGTTPTTGVVKFVVDLAGTGDVIQITAGTTLYLRVDDGDVNYDNAVKQAVTVTLRATSGDTATVTLTETGVNTGIFTGALPTQSASPVAGDGILQVTPGATVNAEYIDGIDASYNLNQIRADSVWIITLEPAISLAKSATPATAPPGTEVLYTVHYRNQGLGVASNLIIADTIPIFTTYVTGSLKAGNAASTYATASPLTDAADADTGQFGGTGVIFTIGTVAADNGVANAGSDEGKVYFKVKID
ncbi:MAG TPA: hypothetical protein PKH03_07515 [Syntrophales bacterium]|nr:hypothetical protein [Syntrophales bacterium]